MYWKKERNSSKNKKAVLCTGLIIATHETAPLFLCSPFKLATHNLLLSTLTWGPCSYRMLVFQAACKLVIRSMVYNSGRFNGNVTFDEIDFLRWSIARYNLNYIQDISNKSRMSQVSKYFSFVVGRDPFERWVYDYSGQTMLGRILFQIHIKVI